MDFRALRVVTPDRAGRLLWELGWVVTDRAPDDRWVRFQQHNRAFDDADGGRHPGDLFVQVQESAILRIEVRYEPTGKRSRRFDWQLADDDGEPGEAPPAGSG